MAGLQSDVVIPSLKLSDLLEFYVLMGSVRKRVLIISASSESGKKSIEAHTGNADRPRYIRDGGRVR